MSKFYLHNKKIITHNGKVVHIKNERPNYLDDYAGKTVKILKKENLLFVKNTTHIAIALKDEPTIP